MMIPDDPHAFDLATQVRQALKDFRRDSAGASNWRALWLYRALRRAGGFHNDRQVVNRILVDAVDRLAQVNRSYAQILRLRYFDNLQVYHVANELNLAESTVYAQQRAAIVQLIEIIATTEAAAREEAQKRLSQRLPLAPYHALVGFDAVVDDLIKSVIAPGPPWLISVEGIGGIGKTSLVHAALQRMVDLGRFDDMAWVTAKNTRLSLSGDLLPQDGPTFTGQGLVRYLVSELMPNVLAGGSLSSAQMQDLLHGHLQQAPHLLVVDNLETVADWTALLPTLRRLAAPTKIIMTTREGLYGEPGVFPFLLTELTVEHSLELLRQDAAASNLSEVVTASDALLCPIVETVGGNPLALRLVVGLLHVHGLAALVDDLREARGMAVDNLYTFIYRRAWDSLDETSRHALLNMALVRPSGDTMAYLEEISELSPHELRSALQKLVKLNLVEVRGDIQHRLYGIHSLTRTFLLRQVAKWM